MTDDGLFLIFSIITISHAITLPMICDARPSIKRPWLLWSGAFMLLELAWLSDVVPVAGFAISALLYALVALYVWEGPALKSLFLFLSYFAYYLFGAGLSMELTKLVYEGTAYNMAVSMVSLAVMALIYTSIIRFGFKDYINKLAGGVKEGWGVLSAFAGAVFIVVALSMLPAFLRGIGRGAFDLVALISLASLVSASYGIVFQMLRLLKKRSDESMLLSSGRIMERELEAEMQIVDNARRFKHDMRHHNRIIMDYLLAGDCEEAVKYIKEYDSSLGDMGLE